MKIVPHKDKYVIIDNDGVIIDDNKGLGYVNIFMAQKIYFKNNKEIENYNKDFKRFKKQQTK